WRWCATATSPTCAAETCCRFPPTRSIDRKSSALTAQPRFYASRLSPHTLLRGGAQPEVGLVTIVGIVERHRPIRCAIEKLAHEGILGDAHFRAGSFSGNHAVRDQVNVIDDLHGFNRIVRDNYRSCSERVVE